MCRACLHYSKHQILFTLHCKGLQSTPYSFYTLQIALYSTLLDLANTLYCKECTWFSVQYIHCTVHGSAYITYTVQCTRFSVHFIHCTVFTVQCTRFSQNIWSLFRSNLFLTGVFNIPINCPTHFMFFQVPQFFFFFS